MRLIDADVLKEDLTRFYDNEVTAKELIDEQPTIGGWISVKDRLPEINEPVLFTGKNDIGNRYPAQKGYYSGDEWYTFGGLWDKPLDRVTHWMPLPEPPED